LDGFLAEAAGIERGVGCGCIARLPSLVDLADGLYDVEFRDLRDDVGNFGDTDNNAANGIQVYKFQLNLR